MVNNSTSLIHKSTYNNADVNSCKYVLLLTSVISCFIMKSESSIQQSYCKVIIQTLHSYLFFANTHRNQIVIPHEFYYNFNINREEKITKKGPLCPSISSFYFLRMHSICNLLLQRHNHHLRFQINYKNYFYQIFAIIY